MQEEYYESEEELEARFEAELEELANKPVYEYATLDKFHSAPTDFLTKKLWIKYTLSKKPVPEEVLDRMVAIILKEVEYYSEKNPPTRGLKKSNEKMLFKLRYFAEEEPDHFWEILHGSDMIFRTIGFDNAMLEKLRSWLPERRKFLPKELNSIFNALELGKETPPKEKAFDGGTFRKRYKRAGLNSLIQEEKAKSDLFKM